LLVDVRVLLLPAERLYGGQLADLPIRARRASISIETSRSLTTVAGSRKSAGAICVRPSRDR